MIIPENIVQILSELPVEEVAERLGISVKKHKAQCFMHDDHSPSLKFSPQKNLFFCFVCNKGGGPIQLVQEHEGWTFQDACVWLGDKFHIWRPEDKQYKKPVKRFTKRVFLPKAYEDDIVLDEEIYTWLIENARLSELSKQFLFKERHFRPEVIRGLKIKSVSDPRRVLNKLIALFGIDRCLKSGLVRNGEYGHYFYFYAPCLLFPYYEKDGKLIGIQSRYLGDRKDAPRFQFMSSQKTRVFNLPILNTMSRGDKLFISEGITDCLALLSADMKAVAIPSATILPLEDLALLRSYDLHMYPDQDEAGQRAFMDLRRFFVNNYSSLKAEILPDGMKDFCDYYINVLVANGKE